MRSSVTSALAFFAFLAIAAAAPTPWHLSGTHVARNDEYGGRRGDWDDDYYYDDGRRYGDHPCHDRGAGGLGYILDPTLCGVTGTVNNICMLISLQLPVFNLTFYLREYLAYKHAKNRFPLLSRYVIFVFIMRRHTYIFAGLSLGLGWICRA
jgi:hypothetical protein